MKVLFVTLYFLVLHFSKCMDCVLNESEVYPLSYQNVDRNGTTLYFNSVTYENGDLCMLAQTSLYNENFTRYSNNIRPVMLASRLNSTTGEVKWAKAFYVNSSSTLFLNPGMYIREPIVWFVYYENITRFISRIDQDGKILQIIASGAKSLNSIDMMSFLEILSDTEFMMAQFGCISYNFLVISSSSICDVSVLRMTTQPKVEYNLMMDYQNFVDGPIMIKVFNNSCYLFWVSGWQFLALTYFPLDKNKIDIPTIK